MELVVFPEVGPPPPFRAVSDDLDLGLRAQALTATLEFLHGKGMELPRATPEDRKLAAAVVVSYAADPGLASRRATSTRMGQMTPAALRHIDRMLKDFGTHVVADSVQIRTYVTNKLLEESDNPDPKIRMRALELLGKLSDVGLFIERRETTVTHQTTEDLRANLRAKLGKLVQDDVVDAEVVDPTPLPTPVQDEEPPEADVADLLSRFDD